MKFSFFIFIKTASFACIFYLHDLNHISNSYILYYYHFSVANSKNSTGVGLHFEGTNLQNRSNRNAFFTFHIPFYLLKSQFQLYNTTHLFQFYVITIHSRLKITF